MANGVSGGCDECAWCVDVGVVAGIGNVYMYTYLFLFGGLLVLVFKHYLGEHFENIAFFTEDQRIDSMRYTVFVAGRGNHDDGRCVLAWLLLVVFCVMH